MAAKAPIRVHSIAEYHRLRGLPKPEHPLISIIHLDELEYSASLDEHFVLDFYSIAMKRCLDTKFRYGQQQYDFDEGVMFFIAPGQIFSVQVTPASKRSGWMLLLHPDFLWGSHLAAGIRKYEYFDYAVHEALFLSEKEEQTLAEIFLNIRAEYHSNIDKFSQGIIISQVETLLQYSDRFYQRQFITRKITNHEVLDRLEKLLTDYFSSDDLAAKGLPTVQYIAGALNVSPNYLGGLLKTLTGQSTQQHIHGKLIEKAKEKLSTTTLSVSEIAYALGFGHPQSFSKLFKSKTNVSPLEFRQSFN